MIIGLQQLGSGGNRAYAAPGGNTEPPIALPINSIPSYDYKKWTTDNTTNGNTVSMNQTDNRATMFQKYGVGGTPGFRSVYIICHQVLARDYPSPANYNYRLEYTIYENTNSVKLMLEYKDTNSGGSFESIQLETTSSEYPKDFTAEFFNDGKDDLSIRIQESTDNPNDTGCVIGAIKLQKLYAV